MQASMKIYEFTKFYGIMGPVLETISQMFRNYMKFFIISEIMAQISIRFTELWS